MFSKLFILPQRNTSIAFNSESKRDIEKKKHLPHSSAPTLIILYSDLHQHPSLSQPTTSYLPAAPKARLNNKMIHISWLDSQSKKSEQPSKSVGRSLVNGARVEVGVDTVSGRLWHYINVMSYDMNNCLHLSVSYSLQLRPLEDMKKIARSILQCLLC